MQRKTLVAAMVVIAGIAAGVAVLRPVGEGDGRTREPQSVGEIALDYLGQDPTMRLSSFGGRPVVVNYFATWCLFCVAEMPEFERVHASLGGRVAFVGIALEDSAEGARRLVEKTGVTYAVAQDPDGRSFTRLGGRGMPTTLFVDARGRIIERFTGPLSEDALRSRITKHFGV